MICATCNLEKIKLNSGKRNRDGRYVYVDQTGRRWNGTMCPDCKNTNTRAWKSMRFCRKDRGGCGRPLTAGRYFLCISCLPILGNDPVEIDTHCYLK